MRKQYLKNLVDGIFIGRQASKGVLAETLGKCLNRQELLYIDLEKKAKLTSVTSVKLTQELGRDRK